MVKPTLEQLSVAGKLSAESGIPVDNILESLHEKARSVAEKAKSPNGKCRILGVDRYDREDWVEKECDDPIMALTEARRLTAEAKPFASGYVCCGYSFPCIRP